MSGKSIVGGGNNDGNEEDSCAINEQPSDSLHVVDDDIDVDGQILPPATLTTTESNVAIISSPINLNKNVHNLINDSSTTAPTAITPAEYPHSCSEILMLDRHIFDWTVDDVSTWLSLNRFQAYIELFCDRHRIDGPVLIELSADDLRGEPLSLTVFGDIKRLCLAFAAIRDYYLKQLEPPELEEVVYEEKEDDDVFERENMDEDDYSSKRYEVENNVNLQSNPRVTNNISHKHLSNVDNLKNLPMPSYKHDHQQQRLQSQYHRVAKSKFSLSPLSTATFVIKPTHYNQQQQQHQFHPTATRPLQNRNHSQDRYTRSSRKSQNFSKNPSNHFRLQKEEKEKREESYQIEEKVEEKVATNFKQNLKLDKKSKPNRLLVDDDVEEKEEKEVEDLEKEEEEEDDDMIMMDVDDRTGNRTLNNIAVAPSYSPLRCDNRHRGRHPTNRRGDIKSGSSGGRQTSHYTRYPYHSVPHENNITVLSTTSSSSSSASSSSSSLLLSASASSSPSSISLSSEDSDDFDSDFSKSKSNTDSCLDSGSNLNQSQHHKDDYNQHLQHSYQQNVNFFSPNSSSTSARQIQIIPNVTTGAKLASIASFYSSQIKYDPDHRDSERHLRMINANQSQSAAEISQYHLSSVASVPIAAVMEKRSKLINNINNNCKENPLLSRIKEDAAGENDDVADDDDDNDDYDEQQHQNDRRHRSGHNHRHNSRRHRAQSSHKHNQHQQRRSHNQPHHRHHHHHHHHRKSDFKPEAWKAVVAMLYFFMSTWVTAIVMVIVHDRVPDMDTYPPLPDILLDNLPLIPWAFGMCEFCGLILFIIWALILTFHKHRFILIRRMFSLFGSVFLLRCVTMLITSLSVPGRHLECKARPYGSWMERINQAYLIWQGGGMSIQGVRTCGDYMFSGHTVVLTLLNFFITEYTPTALYLVHTLSWVLNLFGIFFILAAHEHYSIDVFIAFYISTRLFLYYHTLANNRALYQRDRHRTRIWFPLFYFFESSINDIVPNQFEIPFRKLKHRFVAYIRAKFSDGFVCISPSLAISTPSTTSASASSTSLFTAILTQSSYWISSASAAVSTTNSTQNTLSSSSSLPASSSNSELCDGSNLPKTKQLFNGNFGSPVAVVAAGTKSNSLTSSSGNDEANIYANGKVKTQ